VDIVGGWLLGALVLASFIFAAQALRPAVQASAGTNWPQADFVAAALPPLTGSEIVR
jgi:membrane-associated phospholipid phosphatase